MNKLILTLFCLCVIFSSCEHRVEELFVNKTFNQIELLAKSKYELECYGVGVSAPDKIQRFSLSFAAKPNYSIEDARKLLIDVAEDYIDIINATPVVKQNISNPPMTEYKLSVFIAFKDTNGDYSKNLSAVSLYEGKITYYKLDSSGELISNLEESYDKAFTRVYDTLPPLRYDHYY